ncbi:hypothetical protein DFH06DRAFT_609563 [Mycena polygramma]|nr:hypothetical protein DFH06DRAFT_609563 [Mycena polygramma]
MSQSTLVWSGRTVWKRIGVWLSVSLWRTHRRDADPSTTSRCCLEIRDQDRDNEMAGAVSVRHLGCALSNSFALNSAYV